LLNGEYKVNEFRLACLQMLNLLMENSSLSVLVQHQEEYFALLKQHIETTQSELHPSTNCL